ncbi:Ger(x)C family spore germination protein [Alkalihalobacillus trypoxylicola]|uniref:Uncharacterized protein n=1 Tax=Alkalihalobacillus trypoxylicola TaxID=519424 RepID=A0A162DG48_9BACI|nr:Ger(x)C family spore germination protein [Alkalihalobacillus trypoxylicola]KYG29514.1 hypothetical protein AZF04_08315 [Alkalihalobacillus trypoxylicola]
MNKKIKKILILFLVICTLSGCWNSRELNELSISAALGIDYTDDENFLVTVQVINPTAVALQETGQSAYSPVVVYHAEGKTIIEAFRKLTTQLPRKLYQAYTKVIILGEDLAKKGVAESLDFLIRDHEFRADFYFLVARNHRAQDVLEVLTILDKIPANEIQQSLKASFEAWGTTSLVTVDTLVNSIMSKGNMGVLPTVYITGNQKKGETIESMQHSVLPALTTNNDLAVFNGDQLIGYLNDQQSRGYNFIKGEIKSTIVDVPCEKGTIGVEVLATQSKITVETKPRPLNAKIQIKADAQIGHATCPITFESDQIMEDLEKKTGEKIKEEIHASINKAKEYGIDIFGFGEKFHVEDKPFWEGVEKNWNEKFKEVEVEVVVDMNIRSKGNMTQSINHFLKGE